MPKIETELFVPAPLDLVYGVAKDIEKFPEFLPDVESVKIIDRTEIGWVSDWVGVVEKLHRKVRWRELDEWNDATHTCTFHALSGDWDKYDGVWTFTEKDGGTLMHVVMDCDINVPMIGAIIKGVIGKLAKLNIDNMFEGICRRALGEI